MYNTAQEPYNGLTMNCHCMTHYLQSKDFLAMAETIEIQLEDDFLAWIGMTQPAMHWKF
jgi:hypothetical protein